MELSVSKSPILHTYEEETIKREKKIKHARVYTEKNRERFQELKHVKIIISNYLLLHGKRLCWNSKLRKAALECVKRQWKQKTPNGSCWYGSIWQPCECEKLLSVILKIILDFVITIYYITRVVG